MDVNQLILLIKKKISENILIDDIVIEDKTFLHKKHSSHTEGKFHLKIKIKSNELKSYNKITSTKKIYSIINQEIKKYIHSIQILIN